SSVINVNTHATGWSNFMVGNDVGAFGGIAVNGSNTATAYMRNNTAVFANNSLYFWTDDGGTNGGSGSMHLLPAGRNAVTQTRMIIDSDGYVGIANVLPDVELDVTGDIEYTGTITDVSDVRLKDNITPLSTRGSMLGKLDELGTYSFTMKDDETGRTEFG